MRALIPLMSGSDSNATNDRRDRRCRSGGAVQRAVVVDALMRPRHRLSLVDVHVPLPRRVAVRSSSDTIADSVKDEIAARSLVREREAVADTGERTIPRARGILEGRPAGLSSVGEVPKWS
jgi:hypothetical protein